MLSADRSKGQRLVYLHTWQIVGSPKLIDIFLTPINRSLDIFSSSGNCITRIIFMPVSAPRLSDLAEMEAQQSSTSTRLFNNNSWFRIQSSLLRKTYGGRKNFYKSKSLYESLPSCPSLSSALLVLTSHAFFLLIEPCSSNL